LTKNFYHRVCFHARKRKTPKNLHVKGGEARVVALVKEILFLYNFNLLEGSQGRTGYSHKNIEEYLMPITINVKSHSRNEMVDITSSVQKEVSKLGVTDASCLVYVPHTTAGITINEGADPAVCQDILDRLCELVPPHAGYRHIEGNADSHIKASIMGSSVAVMVEKGRLVLGTWQKLFFCEFDGPRSRRVHMKLFS
jgi:secondary thiamine-phosphate synthase enzyme